jgi:hypothetical protein
LTSWPWRGAAIVPILIIGDAPQSSSPLATWLNSASVILLLISAIGSVVAIMLRFYRSRGVERQQMKWCVYAIALVIGLQPFVILVSGTESIAGSIPYSLSQILLLLHALAFVVLTVAFGTAILKYRLYDIDFIINRTLVYSAFTVILTTIWVTSTTLIQQIAVRVAGDEAAMTATVISTVIVISLFQPLRSAIENWVNERFYPENLDIMRDFIELSLANLEVAEIADLVVRRICPVLRSPYAAVFLHCTDSRFEAAARWPMEIETPSSISMPKEMYDRWGRARAVQQPEGQPFRVLVPLFVPRLRQEELIGILALGPRQGEQGYSWDDRRGLTKFGKEVGKKLLAAQLAQRKKSD